MHIASIYINRAILFLALLSLLLFTVSCAENPRLQFFDRNETSAIVQFNVGPFIEKVDLDKTMNDYCGSQSKDYSRRQDSTIWPIQISIESSIHLC
jgi:hypothetical protein